MALDIQTIAMTADYVPYERPPQPYTLWSAIPRGLQSFVVATQLLDVKILDDDALLQLTAVLPPNFGYVLMDCNLKLTQTFMNGWDGTCNLNLQNFYRAAENESVALALDWPQDFVLNAQDVSTRALQANSPWPRFPMIGTAGTSGIQVNLSAYNNSAAATIVGTVNAYISFWQFDLEQIRKYPINSPQPVHSR